MPFAVLLAAVIASALSIVQPRWDRVLAWSVGAALILAAGLRSGGFDYEEYVSMIESVRALGNDEFMLRLFLAKDPLFLLIIDVVGLFSEQLWLVFLVVATISVACKVKATAVVPGKRTLFISLYAVLLAPGLEFAAIRAGVAIGFLLLAFTALGAKRWVWATASVASHVSAALPSGALPLRVYPKTVLVAGAIALPIAIRLMSEFGAGDPRYASYFENVGTTFALILPTLTLGTVLLSDLALRAAARSPWAAAPDLMLAAWICVVTALVLALPFVTVSYRFLEISWVLLLFQLTALMSAHVGGNERLAFYGSWVLLVVVLTISNILRDTWLVLVGVVPD